MTMLLAPSKAVLAGETDLTRPRTTSREESAGKAEPRRRAAPQCPERPTLRTKRPRERQLQRPTNDSPDRRTPRGASDEAPKTDDAQAATPTARRPATQANGNRSDGRVALRAGLRRPSTSN